MKAKHTIYLVTDYGGDWENAFEYPYMAFDNGQAARECSKKRNKRVKLNGYECDRRYSRVIPVSLLMDEQSEQTCENIYNEYECGACANGFKCSVCGEIVEDHEGYHVFGTWNYCPKCGRKVVKRGH